MQTDPRIEQAIGHMHAGAWADATALLDAVVAGAPGHAQALRLLGTIHYMNGRLDEAVHFLEASLEADPCALSTWLNLGSVHLAAGRAERAVEAAERASTLDRTSVDAAFNLGVALQRAGRVDEAYAAYERTLALDPTSGDARLNLAGLAVLRGQMGLARALAEQVLAADPDNVQAHLCAARALQAVGDTDRAATHLDAAERRAPGLPGVAGERAAWLFSLGRMREAEGVLRALLEAAPGEVGAWTLFARVLEETGRIEEAAAHLQEAAARFPGSAEVALERSGILAELGRDADAVEAARRALELAPDDAATHLALGNCLLGAGQLDEADAAYARSIERAPAIVHAHDGRVRVALARGEPREALVICERYLALHPTERTSLAARGMLLHEMGEHERADAQLALDRLPGVERIAPPPGYDSVAAFNRALEAHVRAHPSLVESPASHTTRHGRQTGNLLAGERGPFAAFEAMVREALDRYRARGVEHPYVAAAPALERMLCWSVILRRAGHQAAHIHPAAWMSGVYYVKVPDRVADAGTTEGCLEFGEPPRERYRLTGTQGHRLVQPEEGVLVLFPSFLYHRTVPFEADEERISVAFDVLPKLERSG